MSYSRAVAIWERAALGKSALAFPGKSAERENMGKEVVRYVVTELLGWTPVEAAEHMTPALMHMFMLDTFIDQKIIRLPPDCMKEDLDYIVAYCFDRRPDFADQLMRYYNRIKKKEIPKFPKGLFYGENGRIKAGYLLGEFIATNISISADITDKLERTDKLYARFADYAAMNRALSKAEIYDVCHRLYSNPLEYLHFSLAEGDQDDFLFGFYQFENVYKETIKKK